MTFTQISQVILQVKVYIQDCALEYHEVGNTRKTVVKFSIFNHAKHFRLLLLRMCNSASNISTIFIRTVLYYQERQCVLMKPVRSFTVILKIYDILLKWHLSLRDKILYILK